MIRFVIGKDYGYKDGKQLVKAKLECDEIDELPAVNFFEGKLLDSGSQCWVIGTGDLYGLTSTGDWVKVNFMGNGEGGGGFTPTEEQLTAMNSGIDSEKVAQIAANAQNISGKQDTIDSSHKLNSDLVNDTNQNNKFVTSAEKTKIANALTEETYNAGKTVAKGTTVDIDGITYTVGDYAEIFNGLSNKVAGNCSHAEGSYTMALGNYSHAEGVGSVARGTASHAEGDSTTASGSYSHAEGMGTTASGKYSHAEGDSTTASGSYSHAEGDSTTASGSYSHAEGMGTTASGSYSHAEGSSTTASGEYSHAEGYNTTASDYSHAEGGRSRASGICSHAEGSNTIASSNNQHVQGKYNVQDSNGKYAFIIGNGTDSNNRSNAFAIDWDGKIYVGNSSTGVDVSDLLARIIALENKVAALENA